MATMQNDPMTQGQYEFLHYECSIHIDAPPERVFEIVGDLSKASEWAGSGQVLSIEKVTDGPVGVGTRYLADEKIGFRFQALSELIAYEPNRVIAWASWPTMMTVPPERRHRWAFRLTPVDGGTELIHEARPSRAPGPMGVFHRLFGKNMLKRTMVKGMQRTIENVKAQAEQRTPAPAGSA